MPAPSPSDHADAERLLRGAGQYTDDLTLPGTLYAAFVRSPHPAARIVATDKSEALAMPGVAAVYLGADIDDTTVKGISRSMIPTLAMPRLRPLARDRVSFVGEAVGVVLAETAAAALDAAEAVHIDYEEEPFVIDARAAAAPDAPQVSANAPGNIALTWRSGKDPVPNAEKVDAIIANAPHVATVDLMSQRLAMVPLEPRAAVVEYDAAADHLTLYTACQGTGLIHSWLADVLGIPPANLRVITGDVGGAFGLRATVTPEQVALCWAARTLGRSVRWTASRSEAFVSDYHGRDMRVEAALALDEAGRFLALRIECWANQGAYQILPGVAMVTNSFFNSLPGLYAIPEIAMLAHCVYTNTTPIGAYRGAGRPDANFTLERLVEAAALVTGIDSLALRRLNLVRPSQLPYKTAAGTTYDSGAFSELLDQALLRADHEGFASRREASGAAGRLRGFGISCLSEVAGGFGPEAVKMAFTAQGTLRVELGNQQTGQNHRRVFRQYVSRRLGLPLDQVEILFGDSAIGIVSTGSRGSRSGQSVGVVLEMAAEKLVEQARPVAATLLQADPDEIHFADGGFEIEGSGRRVTLGEAAQRAAELGGAPLIAEAVAAVPATFPSGVHIGEVEIDPETGAVDLVRYTAVDDVGRALDPVIVEGQIQGGVAQGVGQALIEAVVFDPETGQNQTGSLMDYGIPRADMLPPIAAALVSSPTPSNMLGVKGVGEAGTTAALAAVMNAIADALASRGAPCPAMPATPFRIWSALQDAETRSEEAVLGG